MNRKINLTIVPVILAFYEIANYLSIDAYLPALPSITRDLSTTHHLAQLSLTTWFLGSASMQLFLGPLSDRLGRRPVLLTGGVVFVISTLCCSLTTNISFLLIARFVQGACIPAMIIPSYATIHELFNREQAIHAISRMRSITVLAPSFGPLLGGVILLFLAWRWIFVFLAIWAVIALLILFFKLPETLLPENRHKIDIKKIAANYFSLLKNINFMRNSLIVSLLFGAMLAWITAGPFLVISEFHFSTLDFGIFQALIFWLLYCRHEPRQKNL